MQFVWKLFLLASLVSVCSAIACYECTKHNWNERCDPTQWLQCPPFVTHCETFVSKGNDTLIINYSCGSDACKLPISPEKSRFMGLDKCDRNNPFYHCFDCCGENKCNDGVTTAATSMATLMFLVGSILLKNQFI